MYKRVYKYQASVGAGTIRIPEQVNVIHADMQDGQPTVWAEVDPGEPKTRYPFHIVATGGAVPEGGQHVGTVFDGPYVWHFYIGGALPMPETAVD